MHKKSTYLPSHERQRAALYFRSLSLKLDCAAWASREFI